MALSRLSAPAREAAQLAAVLGPRFSQRSLAEMQVLAEPELQAAVDELLGANVLVEAEGRLGFADSELQDAARGHIPRYAVAALERQGVDVRLAAGESPAAVAPSLAASAQPGDAAALDVLVRAASSLATADPAAAADLNRRTLELAPRDDPRRAQLLADTALLLHAADRLEEGKAFAETALRGVLSVAQESAVLFGIAGMFALSGDTRADAGRRALELPGLEPEDRRRHLDRLIHNVLSAGRLRETRRLLDEVGDEIRVGHDAHGYSMELAETGLGYAWGSYGWAMVRIEALARADAAGEAGSAVRVAEQWRCETLLVLDRYDEAAAVRAEALASAHADGQSWAIRGWQQLHGRELRQLGELGAAVAVLEATFSRDGRPALPGANDAAALGALAGAALHLGDRRLLALCAGWAEDALLRGTPEDRRQAAWILVGQAMSGGDPVRARTLVLALDVADEPLLPCFPTDVTNLPQLVRIGLAAGDHALADAGAARAAELRQENAGIASIAGAAAHAQGLRRQDAEALDEAVAHFAQTPRRPALASALEDSGALAAAGGDRAQAVAHLDRALALYGDMGATWDATRVRRRLRRLGVRRSTPPPAVQTTAAWAALTPAEVGVMRLVAQGMTNREVAEHLFISPHTVSSQLRRVFAQLDVKSRSELAAAVAIHDAEHSRS